MAESIADTVVLLAHHRLSDQLGRRCTAFEPGEGQPKEAEQVRLADASHPHIPHIPQPSVRWIRERWMGVPSVRDGNGTSDAAMPSQSSHAGDLCACEDGRRLP